MNSNQQSQVEAVDAWAEAGLSVAEAASATWWNMASSAVEFWTLPATAMVAAGEAAAEAGRKAERKPRSWYRKPPATPLDAMMNLFDPTRSSPGSAMAWSATPMDPFAWFGPRGWHPQSAGMMFSPFEPPSMDMFQRVWSMLRVTMAAAPMQQAMVEAQRAVSEATPGGSPYASYRSEGGHAVAQITLATMRVLALLIPTTLAIATILAESPAGSLPLGRIA